MSDKQYTPDGKSRPDGESPKFRIGDDGVIHFDKPAAPMAAAPGSPEAGYVSQSKKGRMRMVAVFVAIAVLTVVSDLRGSIALWCNLSTIVLCIVGILSASIPFKGKREDR